MDYQLFDRQTKRSSFPLKSLFPGDFGRRRQRDCKFVPEQARDPRSSELSVGSRSLVRFHLTEYGFKLL